MGGAGVDAGVIQGCDGDESRAVNAAGTRGAHAARAGRGGQALRGDGWCRDGKGVIQGCDGDESRAARAAGTRGALLLAPGEGVRPCAAMDGAGMAQG